MTTPTQPLPGRTEGPAAQAQIRRFVVAVERALDDLPADDVAELVGGLEADLAEAWVVEGTAPAERFGSPDAYAGELRAAAGLPPRPPKPAARNGFRDSVRSVLMDARLAVTRLPGWPAARDLAVVMRPIWWALRGYAAYLVAVNLFTRARAGGHLVPQSLPLFAVLLVLVLASVALGRRSVSVDNLAWRSLLVAMNVVAFGALVILAEFSGGPSTVSYVYGNADQIPEHGLYNDGYQVVNVFPYDRDGKPLAGVQLFDDRGKPIQIGSGGRGFVDAQDARYRLVPAIGKDGQQRWNVFPMRVLRRYAGDDLASIKPGDRPVPEDAKMPDPTQDPLLVAAGRGSSAKTGSREGK